jgi:hypothetical protein
VKKGVGMSLRELHVFDKVVTQSEIAWMKISSNVDKTIGHNLEHVGTE